MKIAFYSAKDYEIPFFQSCLTDTAHELVVLKQRLSADTAALAAGCEAVCCFVTDQIDAACIEALNEMGVRLIALRSTGHDHVDKEAAAKAGIAVVNVAAYSPHAVAEFAVGLLLNLMRKIHQAHQRVQAHNFSLEGLLGSNVHDKTVGVIGTGSIGSIFCRIMLGFGCSVLAYDIVEDDQLKQCGVRYVALGELLSQSDIVSLHCPLTPETKHVINAQAFQVMKPDVVLINTGRGALIDTDALLHALRQGHVGAVGLDVYEYEKPLFFADRSTETLSDDDFLQLQTFDNVLITGHQAYLSEQALSTIAHVTIDNIDQFATGRVVHQVTT